MTAIFEPGKDQGSLSDMRAQCAQEICRLAKWAAITKRVDIPPDVLLRGLQIFADDLASMVGARNEPELSAFHRRLLATRGNSEATVFCGDRSRTDRASAALANAMAACWLDLDEGYRLTPCHAGLYVIPSLLAEAEARNLPVGELLRILIVSYEIVTRVARAWTPRAMSMSHGRYCAVGAAAAIALAHGADEYKLAASLGAAVTLIGPAPRTHAADGILVRHSWAAAGAWSGRMAVELQDCGIAGSPGAFFDVYSTVLGGQAHPATLTAELGTDWAVEHGYTKVYACCQYLHSAIEAILTMRPRLLAEASLDDIVSVQVESHDLALQLANSSPVTSLGAKFSLPHAVAAALALGSGGADAFTQAALTHPTIAKLRERVTVMLWEPSLPPPNDRPARATVELRDGRTLIGECLSAIGSPDRPLAIEDVFKKVSELTHPVYPNMCSLFESLAKAPSSKMNIGWRDMVDQFSA